MPYFCKREATELVWHGYQWVHVDAQQLFLAGHQAAQKDYALNILQLSAFLKPGHQLHFILSHCTSIAGNISLTWSILVT